MSISYCNNIEPTDATWTMLNYWTTQYGGKKIAWTDTIIQIQAT